MIRALRIARAMTVSVLVGVAALGASASVTLPPRAITTYDVQPGSNQVLYGGDAVWLFDGSTDTLRRVALGSEPIAGTFAAPINVAQRIPILGAGRFWTVGLADRECAPSEFPYRLTALDPASNALTSSMTLPDWCRYGGDDRDPWPLPVAGGGTVWLTIADAVGPGATTKVARVDIASGSVSFAPVTGTVVVFAADPTGAWTATVDDSTCCSAAQDVRLGRVDVNGNVVAPHLLSLASTAGLIYAADQRGLWVGAAGKGSSPGTAGRTSLAHVTPAGKVVVARGVSPWSIASGDGETWFLGTVGHSRTSKAGAVDWVLGQVDPRTGRVARTIHVALPDQHSGTATSALPPLRIGAVMGGAVWLEYTPGAQQLLRVAVAGN